MKNRTVLIGIMAVVLSGCTTASSTVERSTKASCEDPKLRRELAAFIVKCSEAANPKSDEEGEDLVAQCEETGRRTLCPTVDVCRVVREPGGFLSVPDYGEWGKCL
jgi:hypothetical protein